MCVHYYIDQSTSNDIFVINATNNGINPEWIKIQHHIDKLIYTPNNAWQHAYISVYGPCYDTPLSIYWLDIVKHKIWTYQYSSFYVDAV